MARPRAAASGGRSRIPPWVGCALLLLGALGISSTAYMRSLFVTNTDQIPAEPEDAVQVGDDAFSAPTEDLLQPVIHEESLDMEMDVDFAEKGADKHVKNSADDRDDDAIDIGTIENQMMDGELGDGREPSAIDEDVMDKDEEDVVVEPAEEGDDDAEEEEEEDDDNGEGDEEEEDKGKPNANELDIQPPEEFDIRKLFDSVRIAELYFESELEIMYDDKYATILFHKNDTSAVMHYGEYGKERLQRRLQIKILSKYFGSSEDPKDNEFLWVTGGHSAAAAHGNLYRQSYTHQIERFASDVFASAGLNLVTRNYAMGTYPGTMELSLCLEQIFGKHIDVFSWDYGMIDGRNRFHLTLFLHRIVAMAQKRSSSSKSYFPFFLLSGGEAGRKDVIKQFEELGVSAGVFEPTTVLNPLKKVLPDATTDNITLQEELPIPLRYLKCKNDWEKGEPCSNHKYDTKPCERPKGQVHWHPGWKMHQLEGLLRARALVTALLDAVEQFNVQYYSWEKNVKKAETEQEGRLRKRRRRLSDEAEFGRYLLDKLIREETEDRERAFAVVTDATTLQYKNSWTNAEMVERITTDALAHGDAICHTALLPAQARYDGIVTESGNVAEYYGDYDQAAPKVDFIQDPKKFINDGQLPIIQEDLRELCKTKDGKKEHNVTTIFKVDFKDVFIVPSGAGWVNTKLPNDSEVQAYGSSENEAFNTTRRGIILACPRICPFSKCPKDLLSMSRAMSPSSKSLLQMEVDGESVHNFTKPIYNGGCSALQKEDGSIHWPVKSDKEQYTIRMRVDPVDEKETEHHHFQVSTFVLL